MCEISYCRSLSTSHTLLSNKDAAEVQPQQEEQQTSKNGGFFKNLLRVRTLNPTKESHSSLLSSKETVYEIQCKYMYYFFDEYLLNFFIMISTIRTHGFKITSAVNIHE